jgi:protein-S-isoprenylcysteine O-methyltransferase Ste14
MVAGDAVFVWAMAVNRFFEGFVRIQKERGHRVVAAGPYRFVRHPGYVGSTVMWGGLFLALGSPLALASAASIVAILVLRTALEDRMLQRDLEGYRDYAARVRYRLVPGLW